MSEANPWLARPPTKEPSFALWPGGQQVVEVGDCEGLGGMGASWVLGHEVPEDSLVVIGGLQNEALEVVTEILAALPEGQ